MSCRQCHQPHPIHSLVLSDKQLSSLKVGIKAVLNDDRFKDKYQDVEYISMLIGILSLKMLWDESQK